MPVVEETHACGVCFCSKSFCSGCIPPLCFLLIISVILCLFVFGRCQSPPTDPSDTEWQQEEEPFWAPVESNTIQQSISPRTPSRSPALWQPSALILTSHKHSAYSECIFTTEGVGARGFFWQLVGKGGSVKWLPRRIRCLLCRTIFWHLLVRHIQTQITHLDRNGNGLVVQNEFLRGIY